MVDLVVRIMDIGILFIRLGYVSSISSASYRVLVESSDERPSLSKGP